MLDFPSPATTGQIYQGWQFDGTKWKQASGAIPLLPVTDVGRNIVTNGTFVVAQRGAGPFSAGNQYTADRWWFATNNGTNSVALNTAADSDRSAIGDETVQTVLTNTFTGSVTAGSFNFLIQYIEGVRRLSAKTVTVSFWAASSAGQKVGVSLLQRFGTGGSPSADVPGVGQAVTVTASVWRRYTVTVTLPSTSGKTLGSAGDCTALELWFSDAGTYATRSGGVGVQSGSVTLWGIQLELGTQATALDAGGTPQQILAECQRFYQIMHARWSGYVTAGWIYTALSPYTVMPRAVPTCAVLNNYSGAMGAPSFSIDLYSVAVGATCSATGGGAIDVVFSASADL